jgi:hypothetical protein
MNSRHRILDPHADQRSPSRRRFQGTRPPLCFAALHESGHGPCRKTRPTVVSAYWRRPDVAATLCGTVRDPERPSALYRCRRRGWAAAGDPYVMYVDSRRQRGVRCPCSFISSPSPRSSAMTRIAFLLTFVVIALATTIPAHAQRVFVSGQGLDTNPCTMTQPCRTFQMAYNNVPRSTCSIPPATGR